MIKKILTYMTCLLLLAGCSDDFSSPFNRGEERNIKLNFSVSPLETVVTRATSDNVSKVVVYVFDGDENLIDSDELPVTVLSAVYPLSTSVTAKKNEAKFYFTANLPKYTVTDLTGLKGKLTEDLKSTSGQSSFYTLSSDGYSYAQLENSDSEGIALVHNGVRVTVTKASASGEYNANLSAYEFITAGTADQSSVLVGGIGKDLLPSPSSVTGLDDKTFSSDEQLVHATSNTSENEYGAYVIVKAAYEGKDYYYRLDFKEVKTVSDNIKETAIDLLPNHWYQFLIKKVFGPGCKTPAEAALNPSPMIFYDIHDHAPTILNMISDGYRELGVNHSIEKIDESDPSLFVKLFSKFDSSEESKFSAANITIPEDCTWLTIGTIGSASTGSDGYDDKGNANGDKNSTGTGYEVKLSFNAPYAPGTLETVITVSWHGLEREIPVKWERDFDVTKLFSSVKIRAYEGKKSSWSSGQKWSNDNYFNEFLTSKSVGTSATANNGEARNNGFHFPVMYGYGTKYTYMYEVTLKEDLNNGSDFYWKIEDDKGVANIYYPDNKKSGNKNNNQLTFYISRENNEDDYTYEIGSLRISVCKDNSFDKDKTSIYPISLYHTGFFHEDVQKNDMVKGGVSGKYTYYEVVSVGADHWLDRNIGAQSAQDYIIDATGTSSAAGYYMVPATYNVYGSPTIVYDLLPPGYDVPTVEQWDNIRNLSDFNTQLTGAYYSVYYRAANGKIMYFPKSRYYEDSSLMGESRAGYYWSKDGASGTEKEETGNWLKCLTLSGSSTSYIYGRVKGKTNDKPYYMSLRAVSPRASSSMNRISFLVEGATHVFLYTLNGTEKQPVTTWPGEAIGNYATMTQGQTFNFGYDTKDSPNDFYVIFNYIDESGKIYTMSKNNYSSDDVHYTRDLWNTEGWKVYGANRSSDFGYTNCKVSVNDATTREGSKWTCTPTGIKSPVTQGKVTVKYRIYWPKSANNHNYIWKVWVYNPNTTPWTLIASETSSTKDDGGSQYYFDFEITDYPYNIQTGYIVPQFMNNDGEKYQKSYNNGRIPTKVDGSGWFKPLEGSTENIYQYGKDKWELGGGEVVKIN